MPTPTSFCFAQHQRHVSGSMLRPFIVGSALLSLCLVGALPQIHYSATSTTPFRSQPALSSISAEAVAVTLASLLSVDPAVSVTSDVSNQVEQLLKPSLFSRPSAVLAVAIAGSDIELQSTQTTVQITGGSGDSQASQVLSAVASLDLTDGASVRRVPLDYTSLQGCGNTCLEESLKKALAAIGATYSVGAGPLKGTATFNGVEMPISSTAGQLWATEVAALYQSAQDASEEHLRRVQQTGVQDQRALLECSLVSLQAVQHALGADSAQSKAATQMTLRLVQTVEKLLSDAYNSRLATQIALLGEVPEPFDSMKGLVKWQEAHRRKLQQSIPRAPNSLTNAQWSERATAVTSFLVLLAGAFGGIQCLTHMHFKRDTLLFGSAKAD